MSFVIYPAIDLRGSKCVRLKQGDYGQETVYSEDPLNVAQTFIEQGAEWLHIVDLDAARSGGMENASIIQKIVEFSPVPVQIGGGVRNMERLERLLKWGVRRVVIGSAAIDDPAFVKEALKLYSAHIAIGLDARDGFVATHGWLKTSRVKAGELAQQMSDWGAETFIFTDISRDGMLTGPNIGAVRDLAGVCGKTVIASGGVHRVADLKQLASYQHEGVKGAIVGKALYTGAIDFPSAIRATKEANL
ncbi:1-(5-phosphoribosyl)-5-[(5-phosphoribosylamino)methylideneamino]imidazole-4-carboxamide isomerase [Thermoactinomyces sp. CICC 24226]|uniref:1-(5-phosphoribosyl)-5-[(5- phosphoribosylamino)methylideneamino]imidazole-4- carboxamide isomerase n=1 Tax=Thermoactinomyces sp. CICC 24226 TaxID=2767431 RepID=UPI0018DD7C83|nr:1-(5-phosphoribosyl)-5-[(5-phosphoribosylamino)methylideneamino]imidazole-4-carboxamide isomerase [Thermoactinomyces sp. CICC 24226]MBI0392046.1 1-(5-phosphoribosyl)-5-[(5-phosphoribosylamino)methylideneamino]imidazole-4-carboxamide isomerase [Thermoactinomyces sp. CICC 24226]